MLSRIRELGKKAGAVLDPASPIAFVEHVLHLCDVVLVMTVNPGFGGQKFLPEMLPKIRDLRRLCVSKGLDPWIEVDGGQNGENAALAVEAGADAIVAGSAIFGSDDYAAAIARIRESAFERRLLRSMTDARNDWRAAHSRARKRSRTHVAEWLCALAQASDRDFAVCLSGGSTPRRLYEWLATPPSRRAFHGAACIGSGAMSGSCRTTIPTATFGWPTRRSFRESRFPATTFMRSRPRACRRSKPPPPTKTTLKRFYGADTLAPDRPLFDVTLLGIGEDGHTASLFPGQPALQETRRWAVAVIGAKREPRITLTYPALDSSRDVAFRGDRKGKAGRLSRVPGRRSRRFPRRWFARSGVSTGLRIARRQQQERTDVDAGPGRRKAHRPRSRGGDRHGRFGMREVDHRMRCWLSVCDGSSRMPTGSTRPPTSTRCTTASRSPTRTVGPGCDAIAAWIDKTRRSGGHGVIACSALKRSYRDVLIGDRADVRLVYLKGDETLIARRIATRHEHFMPRSLLHSQFEALEEPGPDENPIIVSIVPAPRAIADQIVSALRAKIEDGHAV